MIARLNRELEKVHVFAMRLEFYRQFVINAVTSCLALVRLRGRQVPSRGARQERTRDKNGPIRKRASVDSGDEPEDESSGHPSDEDDSRGSNPNSTRTIEPAGRTKSPAKSTVRSYLDETIQTTMLKALMCVARDRPDEPLLFIGNFFLDEHAKHVPDLDTDAAASAD